MQARNKNFLDADCHNDAELRDVEYIMVDPSCSGSGIQSRIDDLLLSASRESASGKGIRTPGVVQI